MEEIQREVGEGNSLARIHEPFKSIIDSIRTETVISRLPRHILSKSGKRPEIRIEKFTPDGKLDLRWVVSFNELYGPARQLAYDLDTLIVERAIEEIFKDARRAGQPLPRLIPIGSLRDLCRKLKLEENGTNAAKIKHALQQNAGAVINTILSYTAADKTEFTIDGTFTCYGVFFTGKKLPDGRKADQIYISTTNEYHQVISTAPTRPLDYNYKLQLAPTARRLYEILSFPMYGAISNSEPFAKLLYSDYCTRAPHIRYNTFDQVKKQMFKVNKPHRESGYIAYMKYQHYPDTKGNPDWWLLYSPGPKAFADFEAAHPKRKIQRSPDLGAARAVGDRQSHYERQQAVPSELKPASIVLPQIIGSQLIAEFTRLGITDDKARALLANLKPGQEEIIQAQLEHAEYTVEQLKHSPNPVRNPAGFIISLIEKNTPVPDGFETKADCHAREERERREAVERAAREAAQALDEEYDAYCQRLTNHYITENPALFESLKEAKRAEERALRPTAWPSLIENFATTQAKLAMRNQLTLPTFEEFVLHKKDGTDFSLKPVGPSPIPEASEMAPTSAEALAEEGRAGDTPAELAVANLETPPDAGSAPGGEITSELDLGTAPAETVEMPDPASGGVDDRVTEESASIPATEAGATGEPAMESISVPLPQEPGDPPAPPQFI